MGCGSATPDKQKDKIGANAVGSTKNEVPSGSIPPPTIATRDELNKNPKSSQLPAIQITKPAPSTLKEIPSQRDLKEKVENKVDTLHKKQESTKNEERLDQSGRPGQYVPAKYLKPPSFSPAVKESPINIQVSSSNPQDQLKGVALKIKNEEQQRKKTIIIDDIKFEAKEVEISIEKGKEVTRQLKYQSDQKQKERQTKPEKKLNWAQKDQIKQDKMNEEELKEKKREQKKKLSTLYINSSLNDIPQHLPSQTNRQDEHPIAFRTKQAIQIEEALRQINDSTNIGAFNYENSIIETLNFKLVVSQVRVNLVK